MRSLGIAVGLVLIAGLWASPSARADEKDDLERQVEQLELVVEDLLKRIAVLEARLAAVRDASVVAESPTLPTPDPGADAASPPSPLPSPSATLPLKEKYDRFTGLHELWVESQPILAVHKDDASDRIKILLTFFVTREEKSAAQHVLRIETDSNIRRWPAGTTIYTLIDGERSTTQVRGQVGELKTEYFEYISISFSAADAKKFAGAEKVEMRAGDWEFEIPPAFRRGGALALEKAGKQAAPR